MRAIRKSILAGAGAVALAGAVIAPGAASAASQGPDNIKFSAVDNGNCTATFTIVNSVNIGGEWAKVNYWVGANAPESAPAYGDNRDSAGSVKADPAVKDADGTAVEPYRAGGYRFGLPTVETAEKVDFSQYADQPQGPRAGDGEVNISYRFTGVDTKDYDNRLKKLIVTGCDGADDNSGDTNEGGGSLGSLDVFGSLKGIFQS